MNNGSADARHLPTLFWILLVPLLGAMAWLGLILALGTTSPFEVTQGRSMQPLLHTGDLAIMRGIAPGQLRLGDVVAIKVSRGDRDQYNYPERVLHRVVDITLRDGSLVVRTKGDNEPEPDPFTTPASQITRKLETSAPWFGYLLFYLRSTQGRIALGGLVALFVLYEAVRWMTDTAEELIEEPAPGDGFAPGLNQLAGAITEYGQHLRSHTRVVRELGGTTEELHEATATQREVLSDLSRAVRALADRIGAPGVLSEHAEPAATEPSPSQAQTPSAAQPVVPAPTTLDFGRLLELVAFDERAIELELSAIASSHEVLAIGAALEALPGVVGVSLRVETAARYTLELGEQQQPDRLIWHLGTLASPRDDTEPPLRASG